MHTESPGVAIGGATTVTATATTVFELQRDAFGKLLLTDAVGQCFEGVVPVRAFPIQAPDQCVSLIDTDGHEVAWVDDVQALPEPARSLIQAELAAREFMPEILEVLSVSSFSTPCTWRVATDRGEAEFVLRGDEDLRRIGKDHALLVADVHGIQYLVRDQFALNVHSRKILDRFL